VKPERTTAQVRERLAELIAGRRSTKAALSRMIHRDDDYLATFIRTGRPDRLEDGEIERLAAFFGVDPYELGALVMHRPAEPSSRTQR
jgi:hypothetical protein